MAQKLRTTWHRRPWHGSPGRLRSASGWACLLALALALACASAGKKTPRYVLIDGGAHLGETVLAFEKSKLFSMHPWQVVSFEPNPELFPQIPKRPFLTVMGQALWDQDTEIDFHVSPQQTLGGSVMPTFVPQPEMRTIKVPAIDFGQWLKKNYRKEDVVHVKLDIEGAEYAVLRKMLRDGSIAHIDKLYIEFHGLQQAQARHAPMAELRQAQTDTSELIEAITGMGVGMSIHYTGETQGKYFAFDPEKYGLSW
jgi:FkbM family methyltransferase